MKPVRSTLQNPELSREVGAGLAQIVMRYTQTVFWLQRYEEGRWAESKGPPDGFLSTWAQATAELPGSRPILRLTDSPALFSVASARKDSNPFSVISTKAAVVLRGQTPPHLTGDQPHDY